jgi:predicted transport protein
MSWTCPYCNRILPGPNQFHSCYITNKETHTDKMNQKVLAVFELLHNFLSDFDEIEILYLKTCIQFKIGATFLSVYPKKDRLELEYQLNYEDDIFPVYKCKRISKNRVLHRLVIAETIDFDEQIKQWIKAAYWTVRKK